MNTFHYKDLLLKEEERLLEGMSMIGIMNSDIKGDWVVSTEKNEETEPDLLADKEEELQTNEGILDTLEVRMKEVHEALDRIEKGVYGICQNCKKDIEKARLDANPASTMCLSCFS